jgi:hypothetical protein
MYDPESTLTKMIELRRTVDPIERASPHPEERLESEMWSTPEHVIWQVTHNLKVLRHDGLPEEAALRKIDGLLWLSADPSHEPSWRPMPYLKRWLGLWWPDYVELGDDLREGAIRIAKVRTAKWLKSDPGGSPPADWCRGSITRTQLEEHYRWKVSPSSRRPWPCPV